RRRLDAADELLPEPVDVAGAHGEHQVPGDDARGEQRRQLAPAADVADVTVPRGARRLHYQLAGDAGDGLLARRVDVGHPRHVGVEQRAPEVGGELLRARVEVGLEDRVQARAGEGVARRGKRRLDLRRVVRVVVDDGGAVEAAQPLEAAVDAAEGGE